MADDVEGVDAAHWTELLPASPLFEQLRRDGGCRRSDNASLMCECRGDLFVWFEERKALLTTNLKRLMAYPDQQSFQVHLIALPMSVAECRFVF